MFSRVEILLLEVAAGLYGIPQDCVRRVIDPRRERVEESAGSRRASYGGEELRLVDVRRDLERSAEPGDRNGTRAYLLIDSTREGEPLRYLLSVDGARSIVEVEGDRVFPIPPYIFAEKTDCFRGVFEYRGRLQLLFNEQCL
jgi:chemotaxis signal transduction protein